MALYRAIDIFFRISCILVVVAAELTTKPSLEQACLNAVPIFNSIHSATRQWGSSLNHNGLAIIPAKVPKGNLLYHGTHSSDIKTTGLEWLAFEPEHSEAFSASWRARQKRDTSVSEQVPVHGLDDNDRSQEPQSGTSAEQPPIRGYLRTYQASRDLNLLYFDGMSAAKGCLGTVDTQDLVMRMINGTSPCDQFFVDIMIHDIARVSEICDIITPLGYDGLLRMEVGFEIVYCDFDDGGLHLLSQLRRPFWDKMKAWYDFARMSFHMARAASQHYDGMAEAGRLQLDFSRMISAYFYPINVTNPNEDAEDHAPGARTFPRLLFTTHHERQSIQRRVQDVAGTRSGPGINWQAIVDAIVSRYADRLALLAELSPAIQHSDASLFAAEVFTATNTYVNYLSTPDDISLLATDAEEEALSRARCQNHYLQQVKPSKSSFTPEDHLIHAAITQVTGRICETLFQARSNIQEAYQSELRDQETRSSALSQAAEVSQESVRGLVRDLQWTGWEKCATCAVDELCFVPMFPFGSPEDAKRPHCIDEGAVGLGLNLSNNYWRVDVLNAFQSMTDPS
ncbi:hypothetical protein N0V93_008197 [Gnomoniopsis smithogilvyi]|uniref:Uncharacterized protein n=1 Tax=Gnomoniopsis smithogilvyi TaxID=1191159 RepID=A0A9W9CTN4_9PEZI|nr:hypothetical protein N0V93_008197 [Gnomoniopsis smithogilvyi]